MEAITAIQNQADVFCKCKNSCNSCYLCYTIKNLACFSRVYGSCRISYRGLCLNYLKKISQT